LHYYFNPHASRPSQIAKIGAKNCLKLRAIFLNVFKDLRAQCQKVSQQATISVSFCDSRLWLKLREFNEFKRLGALEAIFHPGMPVAIGRARTNSGSWDYQERETTGMVGEDKTARGSSIKAQTTNNI
jgi:hypothetical protein